MTRSSSHITVTTEDCLKKVDNIFEMTLIAVKRARQLAQGAEPLVESRSKPSVVALEEIASGHLLQFEATYDYDSSTFSS